MSKLQKLKEEIQRLRPEIMALEKHCLIKVSTFTEYKEIMEIVGCRKMTDGIGLYSFDKFQFDGVPMEILGRPITLEDVLAVLGKKFFNTTIIYSDEKLLLTCSDFENDIFWLLGKPLDDQSEETWEFLYKLIK